ncbi:MAG: cytochrome c biogenesis protein CcsA [Saprospiraceae bacterium]|nr:cytochrome c biogenesis protein CcsA [Saprospiraceae bacterium]
MDIYATGPDIWIGKLGHFLLILAFISALVSAASYWFGFSKTNNKELRSWTSIGRTAFYLHGLALLTAIGLVFFMMATKKYNYQYVYKHASNDLPFRYLFAAFWEGQEGSTMLWSLWHVILGFILIFKAKKWQPPVVGTIALVQVFLISMILGLYFFGQKIGTSPFVLLKSAMGNAPVFDINPNFVPDDGQGLNELLRNYWMVIHPPIIFLGFASVTIPFAYAMGALYKRDLKGWIQPAMPWALLSAGVLGLGILMGGAWAYESLSFGGFWVWDPVENASLVPWLFLVAGIHMMLVFRSTGYSGLSSFVFVILSFLFLIYSTFLTKSGVLGETSVHSFADLGMSGQLVVFMLFFAWFGFMMLLPTGKKRGIYSLLILGTVLLYAVTNHFGSTLGLFLFVSIASLFFAEDFPKKEREEPLWSREFWMFIGALVFLLSGLHISGGTSVPVFNKLFDTNYNVPDAFHYDRIQIWVAIALAVGTGLIQYFNYNKTNLKKVARQLVLPIIGSVALTLLFGFLYQFKSIPNILLLCTSSFAVLANLNYIFAVFRGRISVSGSAMAHLGFALLLLGVIISQSKKRVVSYNTTGAVYGENLDEETNTETVLLYEDSPKRMGDYFVTLKDNETGNLRDAVRVNFKKVDSAGTKILADFNLKPSFKAMDDNSLIADPAIRRLPHQDFFTHISLINLGTEIDTTKYEPADFKVGDTLSYDRSAYILKNLKEGTTRDDIPLEPNDIVLSADMDVVTLSGIHQIEPVYVIRGNLGIPFPAKINEEKLTLRIEKINPQEQSVTIGIKSSKPFRKYILLKAMIFPLINFVWLGSILMFLGFILSMLQRRKANKLKARP